MRNKSKFGLAGLALAGSMYFGSPALESRAYGDVQEQEVIYDHRTKEAFYEYDRNGDGVVSELEYQTTRDLEEMHEDLEDRAEAREKDWVNGATGTLFGICVIGLAYGFGKEE